MNELYKSEYFDLPVCLREQLEQTAIANFCPEDYAAERWNELSPQERLEFLHECAELLDIHEDR